MQKEYDVIVVGAGHAGCEAALAAARTGACTLLVTINNDHIAQMSCNPCIGGVAKGQVVREIDALGGEMGRNTDATAIQFRMLNRSMGAAAYSPRSQCDKALYQRRMKYVIELTPNLDVLQSEVTAIVCNEARDAVAGIVTGFGEIWHARSVVLCTGTFLNGLLHFGMQTMPGGRAGDQSADCLTASLQKELGLDIGRLKTGTPVRVLGRSIDFSQLQEQPPENDSAEQFSFSPREKDCIPFFSDLKLKTRSCYLTHSTEKTAEIVRQNLTRSAMYSGKIKGIGARYCPSFEDKIVRFADRKCHHIFVEPEGNGTDEYYLNGMSTSMPLDVQHQMVRSLPGFDQAVVSRYAYAIEYDFVAPYQIDTSLAVRKCTNLFLAGQINGTSGYEEAAGQGLVAGINAARTAAGKGDMLRLERSQAYIGVMIDDLTTKDIVEPYRLFTSRAEHRLTLRQDNADRRLTRIGYRFGLASAEALARVERLEADIEEARMLLSRIRMDGHSVMELLSHPDFNYDAHGQLPALQCRVRQQLTIEARYAGYIAQEQGMLRHLEKLDEYALPPDFDYNLAGISIEARQKLARRQPSTLGQAARIDGVTPAEIAILQVHAHRLNMQSQENTSAEE